MRRSDVAFLGLAGLLLLAVGIPVVAQSGPESLLPPGFGEPDSAPATEEPAPDAAPSQAPMPIPRLALPSEEALANATEADEEQEEEEKAKYDLPPQARRSLAQVGPLTPETGGVSPQAFGQVRGQFLAGLMRTSRAPFASRWASIVLRRVLLSGTATPSDINGADLAAERAALLLRMGEADAARLLVQSVDADNYTPRLYDVAMQAHLATADPAGFCRLLPRALNATGDQRWVLAQAICASFSGDQGMATSFLNQVAHQGKIAGVDYRLAEKTVGAGPDSRRSVKIEWDGVDRLDPWRFGLATATNVEIPEALMRRAGDPFRAWEAQSPMLALDRRLPGVATAARLGVLSSSALLDYYAQLGAASGDMSVSRDLQEDFRAAYAGDSLLTRLAGMRGFWSVAPADGSGLGPGNVSFAALPALARAAAALPPSADVGSDLPWVIAAMFTGGYDRNAARWVDAVEAYKGAEKERAWSLLAVGLPDAAAGIDRDRVRAFISADTSEGQVASRMLVASLVGLGRLSGDAASDLAADLDMRTQANSRWGRALAAAAARRQKGTVALLAAVGLQARNWAQIPPEHLAAVLTAYRQVGLEPEARMIAAEAMSRL